MESWSLVLLKRMRLCFDKQSLANAVSLAHDRLHSVFSNSSFLLEVRACSTAAAREQAQNATNFYMNKYNIRSSIIRSMCFESSFAAAEYAAEQAAISRSKKLAWKLASEAALSAGKVALNDPETSDFVSTARASATDTVKVAAPAIAQATCGPAACAEANRVASRIAVIHYRQHAAAAKAVREMRSKEARKKSVEAQNKALIAKEETMCKAKLGTLLNSAIQQALAQKASLKAASSAFRAEKGTEWKYLKTIYKMQEQGHEQDMVSTEDEIGVTNIRKEQVKEKQKLVTLRHQAEKYPTEVVWNAIKATAAKGKMLEKAIAGWEQGHAVI